MGAREADVDVREQLAERTTQLIVADGRWNLGRAAPRGSALARFPELAPRRRGADLGTGARAEDPCAGREQIAIGQAGLWRVDREQERAGGERARRDQVSQQGCIGLADIVFNEPIDDPEPRQHPARQQRRRHAGRLVIDDEYALALLGQRARDGDQRRRTPDAPLDAEECDLHAGIDGRRRSGAGISGRRGGATGGGRVPRRPDGRSRAGRRARSARG